MLCANEEGIKYFVRLKISEHGLVIHYNERMQVFGVNMHIKDIYHVSSIKEVAIKPKHNVFEILFISISFVFLNYFKYMLNNFTLI